MDILQTIANVATASAFIFGLWSWISEQSYKKSEFYLKEISKLFKKTIEILESSGQSNIRWNNAIYCLEAIDKLKINLTEQSHKLIFKIEYMDTASKYVEKIISIDDFRYFYGIKDYSDKTSEELFQASYKFSKENRRFSPESLKFLFLFLCEIHLAFAEEKGVIPTGSSNLLKPINLKLYETYKAHPVLLINLEVIADYINDFERHEKRLNK